MDRFESLIDGAILERFRWALKSAKELMGAWEMNAGAWIKLTRGRRGFKIGIR